MSLKRKQLGGMFSKLSRRQIQSLIAISSNWGTGNWIFKGFSVKLCQKRKIGWRKVFPAFWNHQGGMTQPPSC